ncbi:MAG: excalibur calcium-binding domain-containing protein [Ilumatobacteraceae bacterium]
MAVTIASGTARPESANAERADRPGAAADAPGSELASTSRFVALAAPIRVIDTRAGLGTSAEPLAAGTVRALQITGASIPTTATAIVANVTAAGASGTGWLQVFPTGAALPGDASTLNIDPYIADLPNAAFVPLGSGGRISVYATFAAEVIVDVAGYFVPATQSSAGRLIPLTPSRVLDTRRSSVNPGDQKDCTDFVDYQDAVDWYEAFVGQFGDVANLDEDHDGQPCESLPGAPAVPVEPTTTTTAPTTTVAAPAPTAAATTTTTSPPVPSTTGRPGNPGNSKNCADFATWAEAKAWFDFYFPWYGDVAKLDADADGIPCESLPGAPKRYVETTPRNTTLTLPLLGVGGIPSTGVGAVVLNVTAVDPRSAGYVQVAPTPVAAGATSNLNVAPGRTVANLVVTPVGTGGAIDLYTWGATDLVVDVMGYFTDSSAPASTSGLFVPLAPERAFDSRSTSGTPLRSGTTTVDLSSVVGDALAIAANLTAVEATDGGWVQASPHPVSPGASSNLNVSRSNQTVANAVAVRISAGLVDLYASESGHLLLDVTGYFTNEAATPQAVAPTTTTTTTTATASAARAMLGSLGETVGTAPVPYVRSEWQEGIDADGDCIRTRHEVLLAEADGPVTMSSSGCTVIAGTWIDPYTGLTITDPTAIEVDHLVALSEAHASGGWAWSAERKRDYANDLDHPETLVAVSGAANQAKSNFSPDRWLPPDSSYHCQYSIDRVRVKAQWNLTVSAAERAALDGILQRC